jgi:hypothetical protein
MKVTLPSPGLFANFYDPQRARGPSSPQATEINRASGIPGLAASKLAFVGAVGRHLSAGPRISWDRDVCLGGACARETCAR